MKRKKWIILLFLSLFSLLWGKSLQFKSSESDIRGLLKNIKVQLNSLKSGQRAVKGYAIYGFNPPKGFVTGDLFIDQYFDAGARIKVLEKEIKVLNLLLKSIQAKNRTSNSYNLLNKFRDDFNSFNPKYWKVYEWKTLQNLDGIGFDLVHSGVLDLSCNRTDRSPFVVSKVIPLRKGEVFILRRRVMVHYANSYFEGGLSLYQTNTSLLRIPQSQSAWLSAFGDSLFSLNYFNYIYEKPGVKQYVASKYGFALTGYDWRSQNNYGVLPPIWNQWFIETFTYYPSRRIATYSIKGMDSTIRISTQAYKGPYIRFIMHSYGWYTGHDIKIDWIEWGIESENRTMSNRQVANRHTTFSKNNININNNTPYKYNNLKNRCPNKRSAYISAYNRLIQDLSDGVVSDSRVLQTLHRFRRVKEIYAQCIGETINNTNINNSKVYLNNNEGWLCTFDYQNYMNSYQKLEKGIFEADDSLFINLRHKYLRDKKIYENDCIYKKYKFNKHKQMGDKITVYSNSIITNVVIATKKLPSNEPDENSITDYIPNGNTPFYMFIYYQGATSRDYIDIKWYYRSFRSKNEKLLFNKNGGRLPKSDGVFVAGPIYIEGGSFPSGEYHLIFSVNGNKAVEKYFTIGSP